MKLDSIVCMDALDMLRGLPDASVDIVVTSPPYNLLKDESRGYRKQNKFNDFIRNGYADYDDELPEADYQKWLYNIVREGLRVSKGLVWVNHKTRWRDGLSIHPLSFLTFSYSAEVIWNRGSSTMLNNRRFALSHEYVYGFGKPHYWNNAFNVMLSVWHINPASGNNRPEHPCPYPIELINPLIEASCPPDGVVLDPFMGSGTTALAAKLTGRHYIGCDTSQQYVDIANARLADTPFG